jgi:3'-phosphoadenosine 5'-phosphosulfate sulfotransferase (PAPS reductase)/FAD synthetase
MNHEPLKEGAENGDRRGPAGNNRKLESQDVTQIPPTLSEIGITKTKQSFDQVRRPDRAGGKDRATTRLIEATREFIAEQLAISRNPALAWSGGKDSQVLLFFAREIKPDVTILYFPGLPHSTKHAFVERMAKEWNLNLYAPYPRARDAISKDGHVELIELYELAPDRWLYLPVEAEPGYEPDANAHCGRALLIEGETYKAPMDYDAVFIGHRNDDQDPTHGSVPLKDYVASVGDFHYVYPLHDWTEADVWAASEILNIPQNQARYRDQEMGANADYFEICTRCFLGSADKRSVICPKTGGETPTVFEEAQLEERRGAYRRAFVNIA